MVEQLAIGQTITLDIPHYDAADLRVELQNDLVVVNEARRVGGADVFALRKRLGFTQEQFAQRFGLQLSTIRNWEQKRSSLDGPAALLLKVMEHDPGLVERVAADGASAA